VLVNRVWKHHFGNGIVKSLDNFGKTGQAPTHPELLDWLATEFPRNGWSIKTLHRLMMNSSTYRQASKITEEHERADLDNRLLSRYPLRRLEAEVVRDSLLAVSGRLDDAQFGPAELVERRDDGLVTSVGSEKGWRRSIYVLQRRTQTSTILEDFDLPQMAPNCVERTVATVAPQALHLLNNKMIHGLASAMADRVIAEAGSSRQAQINRAFQLALGRSPTTEETELVDKSFDDLHGKWLAQASSAKKSAASEGSASPAESVEKKSLSNLCHALMNSAEFIYVD
jgi:hypothetical protein